MLIKSYFCGKDVFEVTLMLCGNYSRGTKWFRFASQQNDLISFDDEIASNALPATSDTYIDRNSIFKRNLKSNIFSNSEHQYYVNISIIRLIFPRNLR